MGVLETNGSGPTRLKQNSLAGEFCLSLRGLFLRSEFLHGRVQAGLAAGGIVLLDDILFGRLIERLLGLLEPFLRAGDIGLGNRFARPFDCALDHAFDGAITERILGGDAHVFLRGLLDRHSGEIKN